MSDFKRFFGKLYTIPEFHNFSKLLSLIKTENKIKILDVGCGNGNNTLLIKKKCPNAKVYAVDSSIRNIRICKKLGVKTYLVDLEKEKIPFKNNFFDMVVSNMVIEHIDNLEHFIYEQRRVLIKGGKIFISTNNASSWHNIFALIMGWMPFDMTNVSHRTGIGNPLALHKKTIRNHEYGMLHKRIYTIKYLTDYLQYKGFKHIKSYGAGYVPLPSLFGRIDKIHAQFFIIEAKK